MNIRKERYKTFTGTINPSNKFYIFQLYSRIANRTSKGANSTAIKLLGQWQFKYVTSQVSQLSFCIYNFQLGILHHLFFFKSETKFGFIYIQFLSLISVGILGAKVWAWHFNVNFLYAYFSSDPYVSLQTRFPIPLHHFPSPYLFS